MVMMVCKDQKLLVITAALVLPLRQNQRGKSMVDEMVIIC